MLRFFFLIFPIFILNSCKISAPTFKGLQSPELKNENGAMTLRTEVLMYNPNNIRVRLQSVNLNVFLNEKQIGTVGEKPDLLIKRKSDFAIPLSLSVNTGDNLLNQIGTFLGFLQSKEFRLKATGNIKARVFCFKFQRPVNFEQKISPQSPSKGSK